MPNGARLSHGFQVLLTAHPTALPKALHGRTHLPFALSGNAGGGAPWGSLGQCWWGAPWGGVPLWQGQTSQATKSDVWAVSMTASNVHLACPCCVVWEPSLRELRASPQPFWLCLPFSLGFQRALSGGSGLLVLVTLRIPAGIRQDGLWPPCPCQRPPCWCPHLPAFAKRARGPPSLLLTASSFLAPDPSLRRHYRNLGEGRAQALSAQRSHTAMSALPGTLRGRQALSCLSWAVPPLQPRVGGRGGGGERVPSQAPCFY